MANFVLFFTVNIFRLVISLKKIGDIVTPMVIINIYHIMYIFSPTAFVLLLYKYIVLCRYLFL